MTNYRTMKNKLKRIACALRSAIGSSSDGVLAGHLRQAEVEVALALEQAKAKEIHIIPASSRTRL